MEEECNYLPRHHLERLFTEAGFTFEHQEHAYLRYRFGHSVLFSDRLLRRVTTMVILSRRQVA
jgi:hypothetical protein